MSICAKRTDSGASFFNIVDRYAIYVPTMVEFELFMGATNDQKNQDVVEILTWCTSLPLTSDVAQHAGAVYQSLKRKNQLIEIRDLLIGATAIAHDIPLMTLNTKHFSRIAQLQLVDPSA